MPNSLSKPAVILTALIAVLPVNAASQEDRPRARDLGIDKGVER